MFFRQVLHRDLGIARREPDGVPIFRDLYAMGEPTNEVIDAVLDELERCVTELGFIGANINPDPSGGHWRDPPNSPARAA